MINLDIDGLSLNKDGQKQIAKAIANVGVNPKYRSDEITSWRYYYGKQSSDAYDYLLKHGEYTLPAKPKFYPKQRSYINLLVSTFELRPFVYSINVSNREAVREKYNNRIKGYVSEIMSVAKTKSVQLSENVNQIKTQLQQLEGMLQREPQNEEESAQMQALQMIIPQIRTQLISAIEISKSEELLTSRQIEKLERYFTYDKKEYLEELAQKAAKKLRSQFNIKNLSKKNIISKLVTGREYYYVDYDPVREKLVYNIVNGLKITYPDNEDIDWVQDLPWVSIEEYMTPDAIITSYGSELSSDDIRKIRGMKTAGYATGEKQFLALPGGYALDLGHANEKKSDDTGIDTVTSTHGVKVNKVWWKAQREIVAVQSKNPHKEGNFTHFVPDDRIAIPSSQYTYDKPNKMYIHKKDTGKKIEKDRAFLVSDTKGDKIIKRYVDDRYRAIVINDDIVISGLDPIQPRSIDDLSVVPLPIVGKSHNSIMDLPYSPMMITKGLADTYNLLHLHREIILALSGVAGILIDMSQKPDDIQKDEWFYQMKMGRYLIQTVRDGRQVSSFNQFNRFDMSFSASIQYIDNMILQCDEAIGDIIGISRPRKGDIIPSDQVGTSLQSKVQSELRTEVYFTDHEEIEAKAFGMLLNLYAKYGLSKGDVIELIGDDLSYEYAEVKPNAFDDLSLSIQVTNNRKQEEALYEIKLMSKQYADQGRLPIHAFINMYFAESVVELKKMAEYYSRATEEAMNQMQQDNMQAQAQAQQQAEQMKAELQLKIKEIETQLKDKEMQLKSGIEANKAELEKARFEHEKQRWEDEKQLKLLEIVNQDKIESAVIQENTSARVSDQQLKAIQTKMDMIFKMMQLQLQDKDGNMKHSEALKKIAVEDKKASKKVVKEHTMDN